jgi:hypothetical protein
MTMIQWIALGVLAMLAAGCRDAARSAEAASTPVDSIRPPAEALARFREGLPPTDSLSGGAASRDALMARFAEAVAGRDTGAIRDLVLDRAEYAYLYFPSLQRMNPATNLRPEVMWMLHTQESEKGITRVLRRLGGGQARFGASECEDQPQVEGGIRYWHQCTVQVTAPGGDTAALKLFGSVMEHAGRYKLVSYGNDF